MEIKSKYEYKGLVVRNSNGQCFVFYEKEDKNLSAGLPFTDQEEIYKDFKTSTIGFCKVCFCDGTEPMPFEFFTKELQPFIAIKDLATITLLNEEKECDAYQTLCEVGNEMCSDFFDEPIFNTQ